MTVTQPALLTPWIQYARPVSGARIVLLCFPHAGGAASAYRGWAAALADRGIEVWPVQPPGRESRFAEPFVTDLVALTKTLADLVAPQLGDRPYAVFGHSAGSVAGYAFARHAALHGRAPRHLFVSGCRPPQHPDADFPVHQLPREAFLQRLLGYGRVPAEVRDHPELAETVISTARADLQLTETYPWPEDPALDCPVTALGGVEDATVPVELLPEWRGISRDGFDTVLLPGGHFPPPAGQRRVLEVIRRALSQY